MRSSPRIRAHSQTAVLPDVGSLSLIIRIIQAYASGHSDAVYSGSGRNTPFLLSSLTAALVWIVCSSSASASRS